MGAQQSSYADTATRHDSPKKADYYQLLGVDRQASDDEIKKAYRKKALELHPDRNYGDVENATQRFAEVQAAYEVLSDPQERAWYDSHRDAILRGEDPADVGATPEYNDVRLTTADEIYALIGRFNKRVPFDDSPQSFFIILQHMFDKIAQGENAVGEWDGLLPIQYPPFGTSKADDVVVKAFYSEWSNFSTKLVFAWKDRWRLSDAPDRRIRRLMEKENKKLREDGIREFNDAVRSLVAFTRKRDPRCTSNAQSEADRQKILRDSVAAQAARSRAANQQKMNDPLAIPEWAQSQGNELHQGEFSETDEESEVEHIECVVCNKIFKSEKQYEAHEKSKKHLKAVQQLQRQMKKENASLDLNAEATSTSTSEMPGMDDYYVDDEIAAAESSALGSKLGITQTDRSRGTEVIAGTDTEPTSPHVTTVDSENESEDDNYASRDAVEARLVSGKQKKDDHSQGNGESSIDNITSELEGILLTGGEPTKKVGKAKAKREKRAARQATSEQDDTKCTACNNTFESRTQLFKHLKKTGHAATKIVTSSKPNKKKR
ncbi:DnaJ-domain-containing protein [Annulohypoxylon maeteangense]|uniref:DnaJ-domain-containing protein n=1 Tax=Annulohypoxylon maeteangense TaxID=1927788 RepID=UPI0020083A60|nr:DnaJ-domain-containing protein [Annulohypoxylon maeteangense]KAI0881007.1 DnaJ-domain-containing protein [Annulohypoxylon maeteangense]